MVWYADEIFYFYFVFAKKKKTFSLSSFTQLIFMKMHRN